MFASLVELLKKQNDKRKKANRFTRILIGCIVFCVAFYLFAGKDFGDVFDRVLNNNPWLLALFFVAIIAFFVIVALSRIFRAQQDNVGSKIVKVCKTLGMTDKEIRGLTDVIF